MLTALPLVIVFPATAQEVWKPADAYEQAAADVRRQPAEARPYLRYLETGSLKAADRPATRAAVAFVVNSLSRATVIVKPAAVGNTLLRIDLRDYKIDPKAWETLGEKGSGRTPGGEPYYHRVVEAEQVTTKTERVVKDWPGGVWPDDGKYYKSGAFRYYETKEVVVGREKAREVQAHGGWLKKADVLYLAEATQSQFPVYRADWFVYNATLEPRYHELLGLGDKEADFAKLAAADEKTADDEGAQARGAVLFSEVATNNRILERTPTIRLYGAGYYWKSFDFASSVKVEDVLADVPGALSEKSGAHELITSLRNGLQAYFVSDGKGKRLDRAGIEFAKDTRNGFRSPEVEIRNCMACHGIKGMIAVDDEVRATAKGPLAAAASVYAKKDQRQAERFLEKYAAAPLDDLLARDGNQYQAAVKAATGQAAPAFTAALVKLLLSHEAPVGLEEIAREVGHTEADVKALVPLLVNADSHLAAAVGNGRKMRREQWEAAYHQLAEAFYGKENPK